MVSFNPIETILKAFLRSPDVNDGSKTIKPTVKNWAKRIKTTADNGACTVYINVLESNLLLKNLVIKGGVGRKM